MVMFKFIRNLFWRDDGTSKIHAEIIPIVQEKTITEIFNEGKCPDCGVWEFLEGPQGGGSINIKCENCGSFFNEMGPFGIDRIRWIIHPTDRNNFVSFEPKILTWNMIIAEQFPSDIIGMYNWCGDNTEDKWCVKSGVPKSGGSMDDRQTFYFKNPNDAIQFRLVWGGDVKT